MKTRILAWMVLALLVAAMPGESLACGETLFRSGSSMRQHMQASQHPARILVLAEAGSTGREQQAELFNGLRRAGHQVEEVGDADALASALARADYDLVLAHQSEVDQVVSTLDASERLADSAPRRPTLIPVLAEGQRSLEPFKVCVKQGAEVGAFLRAIARAMRDSRS